MKLAALLVGILASALAWAASYYLIDLQSAYLALWPQSNSQQFFGLVSWHAIVAASLAGGLVTVFVPLTGGLILAAAALAWGILGTRLSVGFDIQILVPLGLSAVGAVAAFGAAIRGVLRRRAERRPLTEEERARENALRLEPSVDLRRALEEQGAATTRKVAVEDTSGDAGAFADESMFADVAPEPEAGQSPEPDGLPDPTPRIPPAPPRAPSHAGLAALAAVNVFVLMLLTAAVGLLLYSEYRSGALSAALGLAAPTAGAESPPGEASVADKPVGSGAVLTAALDGADEEAPRVRVTTTPFESRLVESEDWDDPFAYCAAVGTMDEPDRRYTGPHLVPALAEALDVPQTSSADRARWRCVDGAVMACASFDWPVCASVPTPGEMAEYCASHPDRRGLQAPGGRWHCAGTEPELPVDWPVDARGYLPRAWVAVPAPLVPGAEATAGESGIPE